MDEFLAIIKLFAGNFAPRGYAFCNGQILSIAQNTALFSLLGTTYGGNGQTTFALPDFRGRVPVGTGQGPGLPSVNLGEVSGSASTILNTTQMPAHNHTITTTVTLNAVPTAGNSVTPTGNYIAASRSATAAGFISTGTPEALNPGSTTASSTSGINGNNQPFSNMQPYLGMNFIICIEGLYPSRN